MDERSSSSGGLVALNLLVLGLRVSGLIEIDSAQRVSDLLNAQDQSLSLTDVRFTTLEGTRLESQSKFVVEKQNILIAVPRESKEYLFSRRFERLGAHQPGATAVPVRIAVPPFLVQGLVHLAPPVNLKSLLARLSHFFPVTDGRIYSQGLVIEDAPALLINRDRVLGIGALEEPAPPAKASLEREYGGADLASLVSGLPSPEEGTSSHYESSRSDVA